MKPEPSPEFIQAEWDAAAKEIEDKQSLTIFERVAETYDGEAMAEVEGTGDNSTSFSCGGCFMGIPAEVVNILSGHDDIVRCSNCTRILYLKEV